MQPLISLTLPWPDKALSPNARSQWGRIKAVTAAREYARLETINTINLAPGSWKLASINCPLVIARIFNPPNHRWFDLDNMVSRCKPYQDGIFDAIGIDDHLIRRGIEDWGEVVKGGAVRIEISRLED